MAINTSRQDGPGSRGSNSPGSASYLGETIEIKGEITSNEDLTIEGKVTGNITLTKPLTIGKNGVVNGEIRAETVKIDGTAEGHIEASGKLEISSGGQFSGSLKSEKLVIREGARFKGDVNLEE
ncbi:MAG: polymer-forming cytoskeletal protein [bacterium]|nr:polymer-forming cytoskeletal protein [bacterium]